MKEFLVIAIMVGSMFVGMGIQKYWSDQQLHDFKSDAVLYECGFWDVNADFDWKSPELTMEGLVENKYEL